MPIEAALAREFGGSRPRLLTEPGPYLVGDAGLLSTEIVLISKKSAHERERWVYLGAGLYNGLYETLNERIILYRRHPYELPVDLTIGNTVDFFSAGRLHRQRRRVAFRRISADRQLHHFALARGR
jgi:ornithine decarboxylase